MSFRAGFIGLVGLPNAGKSTLVNALVGEKVGIVTHKPQTTRRRVTGVYTDEQSQIILVDSPGHIKAERGLNHFLQQELESVIEESDGLLVVLNLDAAKKQVLEELVAMAEDSGKPYKVFINKVDLDLDHRLFQMREFLKSKNVECIEGSARKKREQLLQRLVPMMQEMLPESPGPLYTDDIFTTQTTREWAGELIREKCFEYLHQEIPYGLAVRMVKFDDSKPTLRIHCEILVAKDNHRSMVVGQGAKTLRRIGTAARLDLEKRLGQKVFLDLHVKSKRHWTNNENIMKELGYVVAQ